MRIYSPDRTGVCAGPRSAFRAPQTECATREGLGVQGGHRSRSLLRLLTPPERRQWLSGIARATKRVHEKHLWSVSNILE